MKCKSNWVTVWGCFVGLQVALNVVAFEDQALIWLESTIPVGQPAGWLADQLLKELESMPNQPIS